MGEGYAAIQSGGRATCDGFWTIQVHLILKQVLVSLPYIKIYFFKNSYGIEI